MGGLFWNSLFGLLFLGEAISPRSGLSLVVVATGLVISMYDFQWSTELLSSKYQALGMIAESIIESLSSLFTRQGFLALKNAGLQTSFSIYSFVFYEYLFAWLAYAISAWIKNYDAINNLDQILAPKFLGVLVFSGILGETSDLLFQRLHNESTLMTIGIVRQFRILLCLICSHFVFGETQWHARQTIGALFLFSGGVLNLWVQKAKQKEN
jgi:uncharacterized membrane protein